MKCYTGENLPFLSLFFYCFMSFCRFFFLFSLCNFPALFSLILIALFWDFSKRLLKTHYLMHADLFSLDSRESFLFCWCPWKSIHYLCGRKDDERSYHMAQRVWRFLPCVPSSMQQIDSRKCMILLGACCGISFWRQRIATTRRVTTSGFHSRRQISWENRAWKNIFKCRGESFRSFIMTLV